MLATVGLAVLAAGAHASAPAASNSKFCKAAAKISSDVASGASSAADEQAAAAKSLSKSIRKAAKSAPGSVKSALATMADYFDRIASAGGSPTKIAAAIAKDAQKYSKAALTYTKYYTKNCASLETPTTTS
jgi:hypothetical protein